MQISSSFTLAVHLFNVFKDLDREIYTSLLG